VAVLLLPVDKLLPAEAVVAAVVLHSPAEVAVGAAVLHTLAGVGLEAETVAAAEVAEVAQATDDTSVSAPKMLRSCESNI